MLSSATVPARWFEPSFHPTYARLLCNLLRNYGADVESVLAHSGLDWATLVQGNERISFVQIRAIIQAAIRTAPIPGLGLVLGSATPASAHGAVGYAALAAKDVAQALTLLGLYAKLRIGALDLQVVPDRARSRIVMREQFDLAEVRVFVCESVMVVLVRLLETILGQRLPQLEYYFPYPQPDWHAEYARHLDGVCHFDAACLEIRLPQALLLAPCLTADPQALASACKDCEQGLAQLASGADIVKQVRARLAACNGNYPSSTMLAAELNMSLRTLVRKLAQHDTSYSALLDEARKTLAQWYLQHTLHPVERVAERLGYRDTSNFSRCCKRWFGQTPGQLRALSVAVPAPANSG